MVSQAAPTDPTSSDGAPVVSQVTWHVIERYRRHHAQADERTVRAALAVADSVPTDLALTLLGRVVRPTDSTYWLVADRRGMFALRDGVAITYLRFERSQQAFVERHWGKAPTLPESVVPPAPPVNLREIHPDLGIAPLWVDVDAGLAEAAGSVTRARRVIAHATKLESQFDRGTWAQTVLMHDVHSGLRVRVHVHYAAKGRVAHAGLA